jgi:hypothetical protein
MNKTIERVQNQEFKIDKKVRESEVFKADNIVDYYVDGKIAGSVIELEDKNGLGQVIAYLDAKENNKTLFNISKLAEDAFYQTEKGEKMTREKASVMAEKSVINAINTVRVMDAFKKETFAYADLFRKSKKKKKTAVPQQIEKEPQKEYRGMEL